MKFEFGTLNIGITIGLSPALESVLLTGLASENAALARIEQKLDAASLLENHLMINVSALTAAVARETTVGESVLALLTSMAAAQVELARQLAEAIAANDPVALAAVQKAIDDSATQMTTHADAIVAAVQANTNPPVQP